MVHYNLITKLSCVVIESINIALANLDDFNTRLDHPSLYSHRLNIILKSLLSSLRYLFTIINLKVILLKIECSDTLEFGYKAHLRCHEIIKHCTVLFKQPPAKNNS